MRYILALGIQCNTVEEADQLFDRLDVLFPVTQLCEDAFTVGTEDSYVWLEGYTDKDPLPDLKILEKEIEHLEFSASVDTVSRIYDNESKN